MAQHDDRATQSLCSSMLRWGAPDEPHRRLRAPIRVLVLASIALLLMLGGTLAPVTSERPAGAASEPTIMIYGDSLMAQAENDLNFQFALNNIHSVTHDYGGTALCDWSSAIISDAEVVHPKYVVIEFSGNARTECMSGYGTPAEIANIVMP